jgi:hypothetical protein
VTTTVDCDQIVTVQRLAVHCVLFIPQLLSCFYCFFSRSGSVACIRRSQALLELVGCMWL